jgi:L-amino acid N-acyltransferase YncA
MVRIAIEQDLLAIVAIYNASISGRMATGDLDPVSVESRREWFAEHDAGHYPLWVEERDGEVAAWLSFSSYYPRPAWHATAEVSVYVAPGHQRQGIATALVRQAIAQAPSLGLRVLLGVVFRHNTPSVALFNNFGFEEWGHLPEVTELDGVRRDVLILGRNVP